MIHGHSSKGGALARLVSALFPGIKGIYTPNAYAGMAPVLSRSVSAYNFAEMVLGRVGITINVSSEERAFAINSLKIPEARTILIPNGVDFGLFHPTDSNAKSHYFSSLGIPAGSKVLCTIARYADQKDPETFYKALIPVMKRNPNLWLIHIGKGPLREAIVGMCVEAGIESRIFRFDFIESTSGILNSSDFFALSSLYEGFPISVIESLACNLPIVIARCPGNGDFAQIGLSHCFTYDVGDYLFMEKMLDEALMAVNSNVIPNHSDIALQLYSEQVCFPKVEQLYN